MLLFLYKFFFTSSLDTRFNSHSKYNYFSRKIFSEFYLSSRAMDRDTRNTTSALKLREKRKSIKFQMQIVPQSAEKAGASKLIPT